MSGTPRWESVEGRIDTHEDGSKTVTLELRPHGHVVGYRITLSPIDVPYISQAISKMVRRIDEALHA